MNCAEFAEVVHELAKEEVRADKKTLRAATAVSARFHAQTCESCATRLREAQSLALALKAAEEGSTQSEAPAHVEMSLIATFRDYQRSRERARYREQRSRLRWAEWVAAAAAAVVLLAIGAWNFSRPRSHGANGANAHAVAAANKNAGVSAHPAAEPQEAAAQGSDFVPLPYGESFSADDSGVVVRVSMTRDALESLGYPVDEGGGEDVVQADLIVGDDGWPRAVRLVQ
ncbi:MAG TPA: hypothetical protein VKS20_10280 [Candidatus Acidoferrales bacterium]|nr:hypothetical protein [Candidatus Acidoferrales bacterium]